MTPRSVVAASRRPSWPRLRRSDSFARIAGVGERAEVQLHALSGGEGGLQFGGEIAREANAAGGDGFAMDETFGGEGRDTDRASTQIDDECALFAFFFGEHGEASGFGAGDDVFDVGAGLADAGFERVQGIGRRGDDTGVNGDELAGMAHGIVDGFAVVDRIAERFDVQERELRRRHRGHRGGEGVLDVARGNDRAFDARSAADDARADARAGVRSDDAADGAAGHERCFFERNMDGAGAGVEVGGFAGGDGGRGLVADAEHAQRTIRVHVEHGIAARSEADGFRDADVEDGDERPDLLVEFEDVLVARALQRA